MEMLTVDIGERRSDSSALTVPLTVEKERWRQGKKSSHGDGQVCRNGELV